MGAPRYVPRLTRSCSCCGRRRLLGHFGRKRVAAPHLRHGYRFDQEWCDACRAKQIPLPLSLAEVASTSPAEALGAPERTDIP